MKINADNQYFKDLNDAVRVSADTDITIENCLGQRYIASGML